MKNTIPSIGVSESLLRYLEEQARFRGYGDAAAFADAILTEFRRRDEQRLAELLLEGLNSGPAVEVNEDFWKEMRKQIKNGRRQTTLP